MIPSHCRRPGSCRLPGWTRHCPPRLLATSGPSAIAGDQPRHFDARSDKHGGFRADGSAGFVDWNFAEIGNARLDVAFWPPSPPARGRAGARRDPPRRGTRGRGGSRILRVPLRPAAHPGCAGRARLPEASADGRPSVGVPIAGPSAAAPGASAERPLAPGRQCGSAAGWSRGFLLDDLVVRHHEHGRRGAHAAVGERGLGLGPLAEQHHALSVGDEPSPVCRDVRDQRAGGVHHDLPHRVLLAEGGAAVRERESGASAGLPEGDDGSVRFLDDVELVDRLGDDDRCVAARSGRCCRRAGGDDR